MKYCHLGKNSNNIIFEKYVSSIQEIPKTHDCYALNVIFIQFFPNALFAVSISGYSIHIIYAKEMVYRFYLKNHHFAIFRYLRIITMHMLRDISLYSFLCHEGNEEI